MKIRFLYSVALFVLLVGCAKKEEEPSAPVVNFYTALTAGDSVGMINSLSTEILSIYQSDTALSIKKQLDSYKGTHIDVKIRETEIDKSFPNMARIHYTAKFTGGKREKGYTMDSVYLIVAKIENSWKITSLWPIYEKPKR